MSGITLEEKYLYLPSSSSTAVNTPAATDDKPFIFPTSDLSRATSKISAKSADGKEKAKDELESGQQTPVENYLPALEYVPSQRVVLSKSKRILLGAVMMSTTFVAVSSMEILSKKVLITSAVCHFVFISSLYPQLCQGFGYNWIASPVGKPFWLERSKTCRS